MKIVRFIWALGAIAAAVGLGCHSVPLRNPPGGNAAANKEWLDEYKRAKADIARNPEAACARFRKLSREEKFPGRDIANLRRWQTCKDPQSAGIDRQALPPYLQDMALDVGLALAAIGGDKAAELTLATEKSREKLPQREKLRWLELAIRRAEELKQEDQIKELVKRVHMVAPRLIPDPQPSQYLTVAGDFRMSRNFAKAHEYYEKVFSDPGFGLDDKVTALKGRRLAYKNARQMEAHLTASKRLVDYLYRAIKLNPKSNAVKRATYDAELFYGRALWTQGQIAAAGAVFDHVEKRLKGKVSLAELYWLKGRMAEEENDLKKVSEYFTLALAEKSPNQDIRDKILWYDAWNERRLKNYPRAAEVLKMLETETAGDFTRVRARYWLGKTQDDQGDKDQAKATLERLIADDALGYYGLLAHRHLGLEIAFKKPLVQGGATALSDLPIDGTVAEWLALLEEREALTALLDGASSAYRKQRGQTDDGWILLFRYYAKGGLYQKLYETLAALPGERRKSLVETQPELLFPRPFNEEVKLAGLDFNVAEELIYAIMRQESAFDPLARSPADAFGLMQILPEVASDIHKTSKVPYAEMEDLYQPNVNISMGAAHLRDLMKRHKGRFILAVAAYNASENAIRGWMKNRFRGDSLEFIEEIPYEETRTYVRLVMRNMIFYSLLNSKSASIEFPAWVLALDQDS